MFSPVLNRRRFLGSAGALSLASVGSANALETQIAPENIVDVIIIGAGGAGLAAAIEAADAGAQVLILEKMPSAGGNTILADAFNAVDPETQQKIGIEDSVEKHFQQMLESSEYRADPELAKLVAYGAPDTLQWLKAQGVEFSPHVYQVYSSLWPRTHSPIRPFGFGYIEPLKKRALQAGVRIKLNTRVESLIQEPAQTGRVLGVQAKTEQSTVRYWAKKGIVVASGGFGANSQMVEHYDPFMKNLRTTNHSGATGDLITPLEDIGAAMVGMEFIQLLPGGAVSGQFIGAISPVENIILVDRTGRRFIPEDVAGCRFTNAVLNAPGKTAFVLMDARGYQAQKPGAKAAFDAGMQQGETFSAPSLNELALQLRIPAENLKRTIAEYNLAVEQKHDPLGRNRNMLLYPLETAPFYAAQISMSVNCTLGGVAIDTKARVLDRRGRIIPGLFAAGEVTGGIHGETLLGGNALSEVFTMGRIAGQSVSKRV